MSTSNRAPRHVWTKEEEGTLVECLMESVSMGGWKSDKGTFRPGYLARLVHMMAEKLPGCQVRATTVFDCRIKTLKRIFQAIAEMQGQACSGFGWNDEEKCIIAEKELFDNWVRSHPVAKGLLNKPFPYYDELTYVFDRDRATGRFAKTFADVGSNEPDEYDRFDMRNGNEDFPPVTESSGSKRKRGSPRDLDVEGIHLALDQTNEQLMMIAEWPARAHANHNHVRTEFFRILREMPELTSLDRALLQRHLLSHMHDLRGFVLMPEDEREGFCSPPMRHHEIVDICTDLASTRTKEAARVFQTEALRTTGRFMIDGRARSEGKCRRLTAERRTRIEIFAHNGFTTACNLELMERGGESIDQ
ncbi:retrotransposon protein [Cucumis melo var. makuwa]|uniref:Retrotransposon protein n=1 Tax=Cucumis melo var. makuwa TaxID=1194695 RepID=A0A5D3D9Q6_CUCMM|nr:retrotransposon protein [Cucumis melo var. makuwa]TYK20307.1 retrotransposon protein [Cucumis melo var. makuwa]